MLKVNRQSSIYLDQATWTINKNIKPRDLYTSHLQEKPNSSGLQCEVAYWPALAVGGAAQLAAAQLPERTTFGPGVAARQTYLFPGLTENAGRENEGPSKLPMTNRPKLKR